MLNLSAVLFALSLRGTVVGGERAKACKDAEGRACQAVQADLHRGEGLGLLQKRAGQPAAGETCTPEHFGIARAYVAALGNRDVDTLATLFAPGAKVISTSAGVRDPAEFFGAFLPTLSSASTQEEAISCQIGADSQAVVSSRFSFTLEESPGEEFIGVYTDVFHFQGETGALQLQLVEMFENSNLKAMEGAVANDLSGSSGQTCTPQQLALVQDYIRGMEAMDAVALGSLFTANSTITLDGSEDESGGVWGPVEVYMNLMPTLSACSVKVQEMYCQVGVAEAPMVTMRATILSTLADGEVEGGVHLEQFGFAKDELQFTSLDVFQSEYI